MKSLDMKKFKFYKIYLLIGAIFISESAHTSDFVDLSADTACKMQTLHLSGKVKRIQWASALDYQIVGHAVYDDGTVKKITGDASGFCPLIKATQSPPSNWLTNEERGLASFAEKAPDKSKFDDTNGDAPLGLENDKATFFVGLSDRTDEYKNDVLGQGYHLKKFQMLMNISGSLRWIDQPYGRVFIPRILSNYPIPCARENCSWGHFVIEADVEKGPRIAVYGYYERRLQLLASTPWHGNKDGWVNLVGVRDFDRDKRPEIVAIRDPQTTGTLEVWELQHKTSSSGTSYTLSKRDSEIGFSNHKFGTRSRLISTVIDSNFTPINIVVPNSSKNILQIMTVENGQLEKQGAITLPMPVEHDITHVLAFRNKTLSIKLVVPLSDNTIRLISFTDIKVSTEQ